MEITRLFLSQKEALKLFPVDLSIYAALEECIVLAAIEDQEIKALAMVNSDRNSHNQPVINYINYGNNKKEAHELILYIEDMIKKSGYNTSSAQFIGQREDVLPLHDFICKEGYTPLSLNSHHLMYFMQDIKELITDNLEYEVESVRHNLKTTNQVTGEQLNEFKHKMEGKGRDPLIPKFVREYSGFFVSHDHIIAYISFMNIDNKILCYYDSYHEGSKGFKALVFLALWLLLKAMDKMDEGAAFIIKTSSMEVYNGITKFLGEAERDNTVNEYFKSLK